MIIPDTRSRQNLVGLALHVLVNLRKALRKHIHSVIYLIVYVYLGVGKWVCGRWLGNRHTL